MKSPDPTVFVVGEAPSVGASGRNVSFFSSVRELMAALTPEACGCVLLNLLDPEVGGMEFLRQTRSGDHRVPVIAVSGRGDVPKAVEAMQAGAMDVLELPVDPLVLEAKVDAAVALDTAAWRQRQMKRQLSADLERLTAREREVLDLLAMGMANRDVGLALGISPRTVEVHRARILTKTASDSVPDLAFRMVKAGLL